MNPGRRWAGTGAVALLAGVLCLTLSGRAHAKIFDVYAEARVGGAVGSGSGENNAKDFFETVHGPAGGVEIGGELLFLNAAVSFTQFFGGTGQSGTLTQFLVGGDAEIPIDGLRKAKTFLRFGGQSGFALLTLNPIDLPLDNGEVSHKGFVFNALGALDYHVTSVLNIGVQVLAGYHYFFPGGDAIANDQDGNSHGTHIMGLLTLRLHLGT